MFRHFNHTHKIFIRLARNVKNLRPKLKIYKNFLIQYFLLTSVYGFRQKYYFRKIIHSLLIKLIYTSYLITYYTSIVLPSPQIQATDTKEKNFFILSTHVFISINSNFRLKIMLKEEFTLTFYFTLMHK